MAYYIGQEKEFSGNFPIYMMAYTTAFSMIISEIIAKTRKPKITPINKPICNSNSNFIPFTTLNQIFAFGFLFKNIIRLFQCTQTGLPKISIQVTLMLFLILVSNSETRLAFFSKFNMSQRLNKSENSQLSV